MSSGLERAEEGAGLLALAPPLERGRGVEPAALLDDPRTGVADIPR
jgi:hypothetical protein